MDLEQHSVYEFGEFRLDPRRRLLTRADGERIPLTAKAFDALVYLVEHAGELVTRSALTDVLWPATVVEENNLSQAVSVLRRAIGEDCIATVARRGYQFTATVRVLPPDLDSPPASIVGDRAPPSLPQRSARLAALRGDPAAAWWSAGVLLAGAGAIAWWTALDDDAIVDPLDRSVFTNLTEFAGSEESAAISRDGRFVAFLRERDGTWDAWVGQIGTGDFENLTGGAAQELRNPAVRTLSFSPDGSRVLIWTKTAGPAGGGAVDAGWAVPVIGGSLQPWFRGIAELDWSPDGKRIVYHTADAGDPLFVESAEDRGDRRQIHVAPAGMHSHFPVWSHDGEYIYFVQGFVPNEMDIWRIRPSGGTPERLTFHNSRVAFPTQLDDRTLLYLATGDDGSGPWLHALDLERLTSHRINTSGQAYTSIAASADGTRLVGTAVRTMSTLWRVPLGDHSAAATLATQLAIDSRRGSTPRIGPGFVVYRAPKAGVDGLWRVADGATTELWSGAEGRVMAAPALAPDGRQVAFPVQRGDRAQLYVMNLDGTGVRRLAEELDVRGAPAWSPDGEWIAVGALRDGVPQLFKIPLAGGAAVRLVADYAVDPAWSPSGRFLVFSGADVGTDFSVRAVNADGTPYDIQPLVLSRGSRRLDFLGEHLLVMLKGDLSYKELWVVDVVSGEQRQLTALGPGPLIDEFDVSADGTQIVLTRASEESDIVLIDLREP